MKDGADHWARQICSRLALRQGRGERRPATATLLTELRIDTTEFEAGIAYAKSQGWLDGEGIVTESGRQMLRKRTGRRRKKRFPFGG